MSRVEVEDTLGHIPGDSISRRSLLKRSVVLGLSTPVVAGLLTACGGDEDSEDVPEAAGGTAVASPDATSDEGGNDDATEEPDDNASGGSSTSASTITVVAGTEPESLSPPQGTGSRDPINAMFEGLVEFSNDLEFIPKLSPAWEASEDGTEWIFQLREGVKFHDGTDFTSTAVKVTFEHLLDPELAANRRGNYLMIQEVDDSEELSVRFVTDPPNPDFPSLMADSSAFIVSPAALEEYGTDFGRNPVGTGPFKFVEWVPNDHVSAELFEDYWGELPGVQSFVYRAIPEVSTRVVVLQTGEADVVFNLPFAGAESLKQEPNVTVHTSLRNSVLLMEPRVAHPPLDDRRVRQALNMAIDKAAIISSIMEGNGVLLTTPGVPGLSQTVELEPLPFDPEQAKALLAEAGYPDGLQVTLIFTVGQFPGDEQLVQAVQGYWANIGVETIMTRQDYATFVNSLRTDPEEMPGVIIMSPRASVTNDYHIYRMYHTEATHADAAQRSGYSNPKVDELLNAERREFDPKKRAELFAEIQELLWEDTPMIYLMQLATIWGQRENVSDFAIDGLGNFVPAQVRKA